MDAVGLDFEPFIDRDTATLSGGEVRRVAIAGALALEPDLLILDEATTGLDPLTRESLCELLMTLSRERGLTLLMVTNDMDQVAEMADTVCLLCEGRTVIQTTPTELFAHSASKADGNTVGAISDYGLALPAPAQLVANLRAAGFDLRGTALDIDQAEALIWQAMKD